MEAFDKKIEVEKKITAMIIQLESETGLRIKGVYTTIWREKSRDGVSTGTLVSVRVRIDT